jgi:hypothetical protein
MRTTWSVALPHTQAQKPEPGASKLLDSLHINIAGIQV